MQELITIENQNKILVKGAKKVVSSLPTQVALETNLAIVIITGSDLEVKKLDIENAEVVINGKISNIKFNNPSDKQPLFKRIFK